MFHTRTISILIFSVLTVLSILTAQARIGDWEIHSSTLDIRDVVVGDNSVFCATDGGLLQYVIETGKFNTVTKLDGMYQTSIGSIFYENEQKIWVGGDQPSGFLQTFNAESEQFGFFFDQGLTSIENIIVTDSIAFISFTLNQGFGLIEFLKDGNNFTYRDVYMNWPGGVNRITGVVNWGNNIYLGTNVGIIWANYKIDNLKDPEQWKYLSGMPSGFEAKLTVGDMDLYAVLNDSVFVVNLESGQINSYYIAENTKTLDIVFGLNDQVWILSASRLYLLENNDITSVFNVSKFSPRAISLDSTRIYIGTANGLGVYQIESQLFTLEKPNTITTNSITAVTMMSDGRIVAGSKRGLSIRESWGWRNIVSSVKSEFLVHDSFNPDRFAADTIPVHFGEFIADLEEGPDGKIYCAIRGTYPEPRLPGGGIVIIDIDNPTDVALIDTTFLDYYAEAYMVVKDLEFDKNGSLWIADAYATTRHNPIHVMHQNGTWQHFHTGPTSDLGLTPNSLAFDTWGRLWVASFKDDFINGSYMDGGLTTIILDDNSGQEYDFSFKEILSHTDNSMKTVWSIAISSKDRLYALSPSGLILMDLGSSDVNPVSYRNSLLYFSNISFGEGSKVKLDPRENAWVLSPSDGIHVLMENTSYWPDNDPNIQVENISKLNSPLLSDQVTGIDFSKENGLAVISSTGGINTFKIPFSTPIRSFNKVKVFPSPYYLPSHAPLIIDGLMDDASVKIMSITGEVFRTIKDEKIGENGFQIEWDGRDESGNFVGTGVYLIAIYEPGGKTQFEKIAVIQR